MSVPLLEGEEPRQFKVSEQIPANSTVTEIVQWCIERDLDPDEVRMSGGGHLFYTRTETEEERAKRLEYVEKARVRHEQWIREQYAKLEARDG